MFQELFLNKIIMNKIVKIIISSFAVIITSYILKAGIHVPDYFTAIIIAIVLSLLNTYLKPLLIMLTIPATFFSLGLFLLVLNALIIIIASAIIPEFKVDSFWWALAFSIILSVVTYLLELPDKIKSGKIIVKKIKHE